MEISIDQKQKEIIENFEYFDDWADKYAYLISLGKSLEAFPPSKKDQQHLIKGCQSLVWFDAHYQEGILYFKGTSDAAIVSGLIYLLLDVYNAQTPEVILNTEPYFIEAIGLSRHLSPTRSNGLYAMLKAIKNFAKDYARKS
ncbi:SufE family protein [Thiotrichales bacterium 19S3-7]|nr:SufE family protein [Thiotrichales bacterium 19S3-7]MCF6802523.1 SufE family protein [Thiotrichales bacterium 19S3-11]